MMLRRLVLLVMLATLSTGALSADDGLRAFNAEDYVLAHDAFLGARDLESAFRVARKAVANRPDDQEWRRRLARLADWTRRPDVAWEHWSFLFRQGGRSDETISAVIRLAPLSSDPDAALAAWEIYADRGTPTAAQWVDLFNLYETLAKPRQGSLFFERQYRRRHDAGLLEYAAQLAENIGEDERALRLYVERSKLQPFSPSATLSAAVMLLRRDRSREAHALMAAHQDEVPAEESEYWRVFGELSWELGELKSAEHAYRRYTQKAKVGIADWSRLIFLVKEHHPAQAAQLALETYRHDGDLDQLLLALDIYVAIGDRTAMGRAFGELKQSDVLTARNDVRFLIHRAEYRQWRRQPERAWADFNRALSIAPDANAVLIPVLWHLIDSQRKPELQALLQRVGPRAEADSAFWLPFAAAYHSMGSYRDSIHWYRKEAARTPDDVLLLISYADALERFQMPGMAQRIRRHAWLRLKETNPNPSPDKLERDQNLLAYARMAILDSPGDPGLALVRTVVSRLRGLAKGEETAQTDDLILGWAVAKEQFLNARAWMWLRYARTANRQPPVWGESQTALQLGETESMDRSLNREGNRVPIYNRYDTAYALEHWPLALDTAFQGMTDNELDQDLHDRYRQHVPLHANYVQLRFAFDQYGTMDSHEQQAEARVFVNRRLSLKFDWTRIRQQTSDGNMPLIPETERLAGVEATWHRNQGDTRLALFQRNELEKNGGWRLSQDWRWSERLAIDGALEHNGQAAESIPLRTGGQQDSARVGATYAVGKREYVHLGTRVTRYFTQLGDHLGDGRATDFETGYRIRTEYPDWRTRLFVSAQHYSYNGAIGDKALAWLPAETQAAIAAGTTNPVRYFLPEGSTTSGLCLGMGENVGGQNLRETYSRAWRHYYDYCRTRNTINGNGYTAMLGIAGSVTGEDHLSLGVEQSSGGAGTGAMTRSMAVRYRQYF